MKFFFLANVLFYAFYLSIPSTLFAVELSGYAAVEGRLFTHKPLFNNQKRHNASISFEPKVYHDQQNFGLTFVPYIRLDRADNKRTHVDIREFYLIYIGDTFEFEFGVSKVFWGVTESQHLVDIINQTDLIDSIDGEDKLGQPMAKLSLPTDLGTIDLFLLPFFRERTFPGKNGRLRSSPVVDTDQVRYESGAKRYHLDLALRYNHTLGDFDIGLSYFRGTSRDPTLEFGQDGEKNPVLIPLYEQINQTGLDLLWVVDEWIIKWESLYRIGQGDENYFALTGGFEYTFSSVSVGGMNIGVLGEWQYDDRGRLATTPSNNDIMTGIRIERNDAAGTEVLIGFIQDYKNSTRSIAIEASRRLTDHLKINIDSYLFFNQSEDDPAYSLRNDDFVLIELVYYF